jgi:hypothetical protein
MKGGEKGGLGFQI